MSIFSNRKLNILAVANSQENCDLILNQMKKIADISKQSIQSTSDIVLISHKVGDSCHEKLIGMDNRALIVLYAEDQLDWEKVKEYYKSQLQETCELVCKGKTVVVSKNEEEGKKWSEEVKAIAHANVTVGEESWAQITSSLTLLLPENPLGLL